MIDIKGIGISKFSLKTASLKVNGFLPLVDALKELCYQKMFQKLAE